MNSTVETLIKKYEDALDWEEEQILENRPVSIRLSLEDFALAQAIADHYHQSRAGFLQEVLSELLQDFFYALSKDIRQKVADAAQNIYVRDMKKAYEEKGYKSDRKFISKWYLNRNWPFSEEELAKLASDISLEMDQPDVSKSEGEQ